MLCPSVTCAVHSANRTHRAGHAEFHTRVCVKNPSSPNPATQPGLCPSAGSATSTACVPRPGLTLAAEDVGVSCVARHGPPACCRVNPARSPMKLPPLPGFCLPTVAVVVSMQSTHTCVLQCPDCTPLHSHSHRETRLHARACPPTSPLHTANSHMLFSSHTVAHSHTMPHSHTPPHSHPRGHSPAVSHSHTVPFLVHTRPLPPVVPL